MPQHAPADSSSAEEVSAVTGLAARTMAESMPSATVVCRPRTPPWPERADRRCPCGVGGRVRRPTGTGRAGRAPNRPLFAVFGGEAVLRTWDLKEQQVAYGLALNRASAEQG